MARRRSRWPRFSRDAILFTAGLAGIAHETLIGNADRPTLLFVFAAMVGLPAFLRSDERQRPEEPDQDPPAPLPEPKPPPAPPRPRPKPRTPAGPPPSPPAVPRPRAGRKGSP